MDQTWAQIKYECYIRGGHVCVCVWGGGCGFTNFKEYFYLLCQYCINNIVLP